jgi:hypothetical protein
MTSSAIPPVAKQPATQEIAEGDDHPFGMLPHTLEGIPIHTVWRHDADILVPVAALADWPAHRLWVALKRIRQKLDVLDLCSLRTELESGDAGAQFLVVERAHHHS